MKKKNLNFKFLYFSLLTLRESRASGAAQDERRKGGKKLNNFIASQQSR